MPKFRKDESNGLDDYLARLVAFRPPTSRPTVLLFDEWVIASHPADAPAADRMLIAEGIGAPVASEFIDEMAETTVRWLTSDESQWLEDNLRASSALPVSISEPERAPSEATIAESMHRLLHAAGDLGLSVAVPLPDGEVAHVINVMPFAREMISLRNAVGVSLAFQSLDSPAAFFQHIEASLELSTPGAMAELHELLGPGTIPGYAFARLALVQNMGWLLDGRLLPPFEPGGPMSVAQGEVTPLFQIWLMAAVSVGAIVPPYPIPGLFRCRYHRCGRVFLSRKLGVGGSLRFCSKQHGQRYHAARNMKTKSKKAREEREGKE